jgi:hypothetical protein
VPWNELRELREKAERALTRAETPSIDATALLALIDAVEAAQVMRRALADLASAEDLGAAERRQTAQRVYDETRAALARFDA